MRPLTFPGPGPARAGGARLWRRPHDASVDSVAQAAALLGRRVWRDGHGRPRVDAGDVSIAHAGAVWLLAAAPRCVGVDIEPLRARPNALELARAHFPPEEADYLGGIL